MTMTEPSSFEQLMARLQARDESAAAEVFGRFANRLIGLARQHLDGRLRQKVDPDDVMQSAMKSFFLRHAEGRFELRDWDSLWAMLVVITLRKCGHKVEHFRAARRDVRREAAPLVSDDSLPSWEAVASEPTPSRAALLTEAVEQVMQSLDDPRERRVLELSLQGHDTAEVSAAVA